jgi:hypothetical protein
MSYSPSWVVATIVGILIGVFVEIAKKKIELLLKKRKKTPFDGEWYCYHVTKQSKGDIVVLESCWVVSKSVSSDFEVKTYKPGADKSSGSAYVGQAELDGRSGAIIRFSTSEGGEISIFRVQYPFAGSEVVLGVWLGIDYTHKMIASTFMLSREQRTLDFAKEYLNEEFIVSSDLKVIYQ